LSGRGCEHVWGEPEYQPIQQGSQTIDRYTRACVKCGTIEETTTVIEHIRKVPIFEEVSKAS
jgi:hypothetical protein